MGKRLVPVLALLALWIPTIGFALGLGNITMKSALNQPLNAEIELLDVRQGDLQNLGARLGSQEDFERVAAERTFFLTNLKFNIETRTDGSAYIRLTSSQAVTEPFLDFVIEVSWPRGRVLREFTVLVDPPALVAEAPAPVQPARVAPRAEAEPVTRSIDDEAFFRSRSSTPAKSTAPDAELETDRRAPIAERARLAPMETAPGELAYGPVQYSDTLWKIANRMRPAEVDVNQMMLALARQNPRAFYNGNINNLKAGYVLRINNEDDLNALSAAEAATEVSRQREAWLARKGGKLMAQDEAPVSGEVQRGDAVAGQADGAESQASLKLVAPGSEGAGSGAGGENVDQLQEDLMLAAEALDANRQETEQLKTRLKELEEQLAAMQRLISLKDNEMAGLQQQLSGTEKPAAESAMAMESGEEEQARLDAAMAEMSRTEAAADTMPAQQAPKPAPQPVAPPAPAAVEMGLVDQFMEQLMAVVDEPVSILEHTLVLYALLAVVVILLLAMMIARRRSMQGGFEESILNVGNNGPGGGVETESTPSISESTMVSDFAMGEMSEISGIQADAADVDPISEADVYLAYGRHQQAEDIIREAIKTSPDKHELKAKMLEIYFAAKKREAFEEQAQELHDALGDESDPLWARAVTMGHQLCPGNELFGGVSADTLKEELASGADASDEDLLDFDFDLDTAGLDDEPLAADETGEDVLADFEAEMGAESDAVVADTEVDDGLEIDSAAEVEVADFSVAEESDQPLVEAEDNSLDFDLSDMDFTTDEETAGAEDTAADSAAPVAQDDDHGLEFSLDDEEPVAAEAPLAEAQDEQDESALAMDAGMDFDLDEMPDAATGGENDMEFSLDDDATAVAGMELAEEAAGEGVVEQVESADSSADGLDDIEALALDSGDLELGEQSLEESAVDDNAGGQDLDTALDDVLGDELDDDVFAEVDEVGTKLDLARAYVDMGDEDGARNILGEVLEEGNEEQKSQAQELLGQIG